MNLNVVPKGCGSWLHPSFLELQDYLGKEFRPAWCNPGEPKAEEDRAEYKGTDEDWVYDTMIFAYQNIGLATMGIHRPYLARLLAHTADHWGVTVLDYGAGGGQVGIGLHYLGYRVSFADVPGQSLLWLMWRLRKLRLGLPVYAIYPGIEIPRHDIVICFDVIEHLPEAMQKPTLERLNELGRIAFVNLIREEKQSEGVHHDVDFEELTRFVRNHPWTTVAENFYPDKDGRPRQRLLMYGDIKIT